MFQFSRSLYRHVGGLIEPPPGLDLAAAHRHVIDAGESAMRRLADDVSHADRVERWLFREIRFCFPLAVQARVRTAVGIACTAAAHHVRALPRHGVDADGRPIRCPVTTRQGTPCRREPLLNGWCPSHQHLAEAPEGAPVATIFSRRRAETRPAAGAASAARPASA
jgi:hypothetical protein